MNRVSLILIFVACVSLGTASAQEAADNANSGGIVRGHISDTTPTSAPIAGVRVVIEAADGTKYEAITDTNGNYERDGIPAERYLISIHKEGYGTRTGRHVTVVNGGDHFVPLKMTRESRSILRKFWDVMAPQNMPSHPQEHWYNVTLMGTKIGYQHTYRENAVYKGEAVTRNKVDIAMSLKGFGTDMTIETTRLEYTGADLVPRYFLSTSNEDGSKQVEGRIVNGIAYIKTTLDGETKESEVAIPVDTISEFMAVDALLAQKPIRIGNKQTVHSFMFDLLEPVKTELEIIAEETLTYQGEEKQVYVLKQTTDMMGGITAQVWVDSDGVIYRTEVPLMGLSMAMTKTDRKTALGDIGELDIVLRTRILPGGKRPTPNAERLVAYVKLTEGNIAQAVMSTSFQQLAVTSEQAGTLSIQVPTVEAESCPDLPIQDEESAFLGSSAYIQTGHPDIRAKAVEILAGETNSWRAAEKLCRWVYTAITDKKLSGGYNSSLTTLDSRSGDCTEHTVLFIALARSVGIPARICSGLIFSQDAFYYHLWPEVYVGRWIQTDPTLGQIIADANHIQLGGSTVESDTLLEFAEGVFRTLNQLEITVLE